MLYYLLPIASFLVLILLLDGFFIRFSLDQGIAKLYERLIRIEKNLDDELDKLKKK
jgi:cytochrome bd-type quinol oxidase subunit 2